MSEAVYLVPGMTADKLRADRDAWEEMAVEFRRVLTLAVIDAEDGDFRADAGSNGEWYCRDTEDAIIAALAAYDELKGGK